MFTADLSVLYDRNMLLEIPLETLHPTIKSFRENITPIVIIIEIINPIFVKLVSNDNRNYYTESELSFTSFILCICLNYSKSFAGFKFSRYLFVNYHKQINSKNLNLVVTCHICQKKNVASQEII